MKKTLKSFGALTPTEMTLRGEVGSGLTVIVGNGKLPNAGAGPDRQIRASFIRDFALGGCAARRPSETGVLLAGTVIVSGGPEAAETCGLDLESCTLKGDR